MQQVTDLWEHRCTFAPIPHALLLQPHELGLRPGDLGILLAIVALAHTQYHYRDWPAVHLPWAKLQKATGLSRSAARRAVARLAALDLLSVTPGPARGPKSCAVVSLQPLINRLVLLHHATQEAMKALRLMTDPQRRLFTGNNLEDPITRELMDDQRTRSEAARARALAKLRDYQPPKVRMRTG